MVAHLDEFGYPGLLCHDEKQGAIMGLRFRKRIKLFPGVWFNLSKSGISTSIGGKGLTVNLKDGRTRTTASIPGTGVSYSETSDNAPGTSSPVWSTPGHGLLWFLLAAVVLVAILI